VPPARSLIVDDEEDIADLLGECLIDAGYEVTLAASGQAALDLGSRGPDRPASRDPRACRSS